MDVVEDLMAQRDAILFGEWVPHIPDRQGAACAVVRFEGKDAKGHALVTGPGLEAGCLLQTAYLRLFPEQFRRYHAVSSFNDQGATREDILAIFDEAIRIAKASVSADGASDG